MKYNIFKALIDGLNLQYFQNQIIQNPIDFSQEEQNLKQQLLTHQQTKHFTV